MFRWSAPSDFTATTVNQTMALAITARDVGRARHERDYLTRRAAQERQAAEQAISDVAREAHERLAQEYERQIRESGADGTEHS